MAILSFLLRGKQKQEQERSSFKRQIVGDKYSLNKRKSIREEDRRWKKWDRKEYT